MKVIPKNEAELIFRFAQEMPEGWKLLDLQTSRFPDARLEIKGDVYRTEFEFRSENFHLHNHDAQGCDLVICWIHDWAGSTLPVLCLQDPDWLRARIPKLSASAIVGWQKAQAEKNPLEKAKGEVRQKIRNAVASSKSISHARAAKKRAEAAVSAAQRQLRRIERKTAKASKPDKVKPLPCIEEEPDEPMRFVRGRFWCKSDGHTETFVPIYDGEYRPPKRW